jgi:hypothetical protein
VKEIEAVCKQSAPSLSYLRVPTAQLDVALPENDLIFQVYRERSMFHCSNRQVGVHVNCKTPEKVASMQKPRRLPLAKLEKEHTLGPEP